MAPPKVGKPDLIVCKLGEKLIVMVEETFLIEIIINSSDLESINTIKLRNLKGQ